MTDIALNNFRIIPTKVETKYPPVSITATRGFDVNLAGNGFGVETEVFINVNRPLDSVVSFNAKVYKNPNFFELSAGVNFGSVCLTTKPQPESMLEIGIEEEWEFGNFSTSTTDHGKTQSFCSKLGEGWGHHEALTASFSLSEPLIVKAISDFVKFTETMYNEAIKEIGYPGMSPGSRPDNPQPKPDRPDPIDRPGFGGRNGLLAKSSQGIGVSILLD